MVLAKEPNESARRGRRIAMEEVWARLEDNLRRLVIRMSDGRYLIYYTFDDELAAKLASEQNPPASAEQPE